MGSDAKLTAREMAFWRSAVNALLPVNAVEPVELVDDAMKNLS
jgi:hypothetical protein